MRHENLCMKQKEKINQVIFQFISQNVNQNLKKSSNV